METEKLIEENKGKWSKDDNLKLFPESLKKKLWDKDQMSLFGSVTKRATIIYFYIPGEYMKDGIPYMIGWSQKFDGGGFEEVEEKDKITWEELPKIFLNNIF